MTADTTREALLVVAWGTFGKKEATDSFDQMFVATNPDYVRVHSEYLWQPVIRLSDATAAIRAKDAEIAALTKQRDDARRAKTAHFSPAYLLANARRLAASEYAMMPNWVLATQLFAVGSTTANAICRENGIEPDSKSVHAEALGRAIDAAMQSREGTEDAQRAPAPLLLNTAPDHIWLDVGPDCDDSMHFRELYTTKDGMTWSEDNASGAGIKYVRFGLRGVRKIQNGDEE